LESKQNRTRLDICGANWRSSTIDTYKATIRRFFGTRIVHKPGPLVRTLSTKVTLSTKEWLSLKVFLDFRW
jgi:hypothetical protein